MSVDSDPTFPRTPVPPPAPEGSHYSVAPPPAAPPPAAPSSGPPRRRLLWAALAAVASFALLAGTGAAIGLAVEHRAPQASAQAPIHTVPQTQAGASSSAQAIAGRVTPSVVDINTVIQGVRQNGEAAGTGIILTSSGEVLTNNHVIQGAIGITVTIPGHSGTYKATVIGADPTNDVALIQLEGVSGLPTAKLADSSTLKLGQRVVAIGNAYGRGGPPAVTQGSIVALDQTITASDGGSGTEQLNGMIQTDASISPGDSGGPLVNDNGQVVGMITAGQSSGFRRASSMASGFAIPSSTAVSIVNQIRSGNANGSIILGQPAYLGVSVTDLDASTASRLGLPTNSGALVVGVVADSPAASIGLSRDSVITAVGGHSVNSAATLGPAIRAFKPGQRADVSWVDASGTSHTAPATLVAGPAA